MAAFLTWTSCTSRRPPVLLSRVTDPAIFGTLKHVAGPAFAVIVDMDGVMTGYADPTTMRRMTALRTLGCLEKPFSVAQLKELLGVWWSSLGRGDPPWSP